MNRCFNANDGLYEEDVHARDNFEGYGRVGSTNDEHRSIRRRKLGHLSRNYAFDRRFH